MSGGNDFVTAQHAAELAVLRMSILAVFSRAAVEDTEVSGLVLSVTPDAFGPPAIDVELIGASGMPVGGFSL